MARRDDDEGFNFDNVEDESAAVEEADAAVAAIEAAEETELTEFPAPDVSTLQIILQKESISIFQYFKFVRPMQLKVLPQLKMALYQKPKVKAPKNMKRDQFDGTDIGFGKFQKICIH